MGVVSGFVSASWRPLSDREISEARGVFESTVPYSGVFITDNIGLNGRAYTTPLGPLCYRLHMGPRVYANPGTNLGTLIHEMTHVWQGRNNFFQWGYVGTSLFHQGVGAITGSDPYASNPGGSWRSYTAEQQAQIVQDWYENGKRESDPLFEYIRDNIRHPYLSKLGELLIPANAKDVKARI